MSFANVEGLGEPAGSEEEIVECEEPSGLKNGLERLWRVWGREKEAK